MFVILSYDINQKRGKKALKICRKYLTHVHNSVFEGEITEAKLKRLKDELATIVKTNSDTVRIYRMNAARFVEIDELGKCPNQSIVL